MAGTESIDVGVLVDAVEKHFGGEKDHIVFLCSGSNVSEVRICLDKSLNVRYLGFSSPSPEKSIHV